MDFAQASGKLPSSIHNKVQTLVLPSGMNLSYALGNNVPKYVVVANTGASESDAVKVWVKNDSNNDWVNDPYVQSADYVKSYTDAGESNYLDPNSDVIQSLRNTKWVNGGGKEYTLEDFTLDANGRNAVQEMAALHNFLNDHRIQKCTITGELDELSLLMGKKVKTLDLSGVTNSDITGLKLPNITDDTQNILLPNGITYTPAGALTSSSSTSLTNLDAAFKALKENKKTVSSVEFPGGSTFSNGELVVTNAEKDDIETIMKIIKDGGLSVNKITVGDNVIYNNGVLTLSDETSAAAFCELISGNDLSISKIVFPNGSVWENGNLTVNAADNTAEGLTTIKNLLEKAGKTLGNIEFPSGTKYSGGMIEVSDQDKDQAEGATRLNAIHDNLDALGLPIETVRFNNGTRWNKPNKVTYKDPADDNEKTKINNLLTSAGFPVVETSTSKFPDLEYTVTDGEDGKIVTIKSYKEGELQRILEARNEGPADGLQAQLYAYAQQMKQDIQQLENYTLVLDGPFKGDDLSKFTNDVNKKASTVDMSGATFTNVADAHFRYWDNNYLRTAYISKDPKLTNVDDNMFQNLTNVEKVVFPNQLESIGKNAFLNHTNLKTLEFEETCHITYIGQDAFNACGIEGVFTIPSSVKIIDERAFKSCRNISSLIISADSQLEEIRDQAFRMDGDQAGVKLKDVYVYAEKEIECATNAWEFYMTDGQTVMATVTTRLHYPPSMYYWYVGDWKSQVNGGRIEGHDDLLRLRNAVDNGVSEWKHYDENHNQITEYVTVTPKGGIGWQKFVSSGIPVTAEFDWRTYSDIVPLKVPEDNADPKKKIADVYIVCNYIEDPTGTNHQAVLKQMKPGDIIPAETGIVIHHYVTDTESGGLLMFPHVSEQEATALGPEKLKPYRFVSEGDKRGNAGKKFWDRDEYEFAKAMNYVGIETRNYIPTGETLPSEYPDGYPNYLEAIHCMGVERAIYNAENGNYTDYNTLLMGRYSGQKVTYRNFFFGHGQKLNASMNAGKIEKGANWEAVADNANRTWGFFRCISKMYAINSKAFLHFPATIYTKAHGGSMNATEGDGVTVQAKDMGMFLIGYGTDEVVDYGIATGINNMNSKTTVSDDSYYTLQGLKVNTPTKRGIYIFNGKKVVIR
jgi:hypothetical protein